MDSSCDKREALNSVDLSYQYKETASRIFGTSTAQKKQSSKLRELNSCYKAARGTTTSARHSRQGLNIYKSTESIHS